MFLSYFVAGLQSQRLPLYLNRRYVFLRVAPMSIPIFIQSSSAILGLVRLGQLERPRNIWQRLLISISLLLAYLLLALSTLWWMLRG